MSLKEIVDFTQKNWKPLLFGAALGVIVYCAGTGIYDKLKYLCTPKEKIAANGIDIRELKNPRFIDLNNDGKLESIINYQGNDYIFEQIEGYDKKTKIEGSQFTIELKK